jgi:triphosphoribosyl-dephospho-CoA synthase
MKRALVPVAGSLQGTCAAILPRSVGRAAVLALYDELALAPKPGLVTLSDSGSHTDMNARTFTRSLFALRAYFLQVASLGAAGATFEELERCGITAEARMLEATGGINTHRGAIFMLGLLCAAAGAASWGGGAMTAELVRETLMKRWGEALRERSLRPSRLPGGIAAKRHGLRSASEEAAEGFPVLFETALPAMRACAARGMSRQLMRIDTFFHILAVIDDSNVAHRGGAEGLLFARQAALDFLRSGGSTQPGGVAKAEQIGSEFVRRRLSPGGAADMLAAMCWMERMGLVTLPASA